MMNYALYHTTSLTRTVQLTREVNLALFSGGTNLDSIAILSYLKPSYKTLATLFFAIIILGVLGGWFITKNTEQRFALQTEIDKAQDGRTDAILKSIIAMKGSIEQFAFNRLAS